MTSARIRSAAPVLAAALIVAVGFSLAGPINPPAGPVASTYKTLTEVEPRIAISAANTPGDPIGDSSPSVFKISQPGSYYLTANITGVAGKHGIEITASGVTVDLMGFSVVGIPGSLDGISSTVSNLNTHVTVRNGEVRGWGGDGVDLLASNCAVVDMLISDNGGSGISLGFGTTVRDCSVSGNGLDGVRSVGAACVFLRCAAHSNSGTGIVSGFGATVSECTVYGNTGNGISANGSVIGGCTISHCTAFGNRLDGIIVSASCLVLANTCTSNGTTPGDGAGIHATGGDNRIEGNNCVGNDRGIDIDGNRNRVDGNSVNSNTVGFAITGVNNIIIRNTASTNPSGNYSIVAGNSVAPRITVTASDGWAGITNANHPWANFGY